MTKLLGTAALALLSSLAIADIKEKIEVPFTVKDDAMFVQATVNGASLNFLFDSGFSGAFIVNSTVDVGKTTGSITLRDFVGEFQAPTAPVRSLVFGGKTLDHSSMTIVKQDMTRLSESYGIHCDGIMGFEAIAPYVVEINFEKGKFIFHPRANVDLTKKEPDNQKTFLAKMLPRGHNSIEMSVETQSGSKMHLSLDTGNAFYATTHRDVLERVGLWKEAVKPKFMRQSMVASGPVESWDLQLKDVKIFGVPVGESTWNIIDLPSSSADGDGTVGFQFLKHFNIIFDVEKRRVWLENFSGKRSDEPEGTIGLYAIHDPGRQRMRVIYVSPDGPAARAGIKPGDDLLGIDGRELTIMTFDELLRVLEGAPGSSVLISTSRGGTLMRNTLKREVLVNQVQ